MIDNNLIHIENSALTNTSQRLNTLIGSFINSQDVKDSSKALYKRTISQYFKWIDRNKFKQNEITRAEVLKYKQELLESGMSSLTVGSYITVVRKFYEWTEANKLYPNVAKNIKTPRRKQQFKKQSLTDSQAKSLLDHYKNKQFEALRDYAVISLLLRTGLRTVELIRANIEDVTMKEGKRILFIQGKGRDEKDNFVIITGKAFEPIEEYLKTRGAYKVKEPLFTSVSNNNLGGRLTTRAISKIAKEGLIAIGLNDRNYTAHSLRHTTACSLIRKGVSLEHIQGVLRHSNPATTQIYLSSIAEETRLKENTEAVLDEVY
ncbi:MAG: tyrosine-type recombinase/integrase [Ignavibacteria bacterium]